MAYAPRQQGHGILKAVPPMAPPDFRRAARIASVEVSDIVRMSEAARARMADGHEVVSLGVGEPDFDTPDHVAEAAIAAIRRHDTRYPPVAGKPELREAVAGLYDGMAAENVIVSSGSKYTILNMFLASVDPGDEIVVPTPYWGPYRDIAGICGGRVVEVPTRPEDGFIPSREGLAAALGPKARWLFVNYPGNPSGGVIGAEGWETIGAVLDEHPECWLASDEIYQHLTYGIDFISAHDALPRHRDRMLVINGVSKSYSMTGWRLGFGIGPAALVHAMMIAQSQGTVGTNTISQAAGLAAVTGPQDLLEERRESFRVRRDLVVGHLVGMDGISCPTPLGAFYAFPSWEALRGGRAPDGSVLEDDRAFCDYILEAADVVVIPGSAFACPGHFRISYAAPNEDLDRALGRVAEAVTAVKRA